ncbi:PREDICTED: uncharacterized protein LOC105971259 [Erythranthe guttata]|uniref:uncharacterized protein LOC105971259 n=1 Tax=Erythranthe guttata TaxID=4155 RepID=UPI00064DDA00|nr:PREDICTED: uncharacterized protein LOC105971259 [Erythranthe guttata]|eukprot:XP_012851562.1 PREDICTED: uncharacterized protein LOC105971259 [Erythranthe guttata]
MGEPLIEIDLNTEVSLFHISNESERQEHESMSLPDLNLVALEFVDDVNINLHSPILDLNVTPSVENDIPLDMGLQSSLEDEFTTDENINTGNANGASLQSRNVKQLHNNERRDVYNLLQQKSFNGKLPKVATKMVATQFDVSIQAIQHIWWQSNNGTCDDVSHRRTKNCGRKRIQISDDQIRAVPLHKRTTLQSFAHSLNTSKSTLLSASIQHDPIFNGMYNIVHIDEKWFNMTKKSEHYYLLPDEEDPLRTCKSKNFIANVMFLVAIARPRTFDEQGNELFSGKIGVFPLVTQEAAKRTSINRVAGTLETKPISSVNKNVIRSYFIEKVIPAIKQKWPRGDSRCPIFIQQDNARTHIDHNDEEFRLAATRDGFDIRLMRQPPNSPDLNVLDLGFFRAIQSTQYKESPKTVDRLVNAVVHAFETFPAIKSNRIFITLQLCRIEIMRVRGSQKYKTPHIKKAMLEREGRLPTRMKCDLALVQDVLRYIG